MANELKDAMEDTLGGATPDILGNIEGVPVGSPTEEPAQETPAVEESPVPAAAPEDTTPPKETPPPIEELPEAVRATLTKYGNDPGQIAKAYNELYGKFQKGQTELNKAKPFQSYVDDLQTDSELQRKVYEHYATRGQAPAQPKHPAPTPRPSAVTKQDFMPEGETFDPYDEATDANSSSYKASQALRAHEDAQRDQALAQRQRALTAATQYEAEKQRLISERPKAAAEWEDFERWASSPEQVKLDNLYDLYKQKETLQKVEADTRAKVLAELNVNAGRVRSVTTVPAGAPEPELSEEEEFARDLTVVGNAGQISKAFA